MPADPNDKILALMKEVERRKSEIAELSGRPNYKTSCSFSFVEGDMNRAINIHVEQDVKKLVSIIGYLMGLSKQYKEAGAALEVETLPAFQWSGSSLDDWTHDIKLRISKLQIASKQKKLASLENRLNAIVTPELRRELELKAIEAELA